MHFRCVPGPPLPWMAPAHRLMPNLGYTGWVGVIWSARVACVLGSADSTIDGRERIELRSGVAGTLQGPVQWARRPVVPVSCVGPRAAAGRDLRPLPNSWVARHSQLKRGGSAWAHLCSVCQACASSPRLAAKMGMWEYLLDWLRRCASGATAGATAGARGWPWRPSTRRV